MPVLLETPQQPNSEDLSDLAKIYGEDLDMSPEEVGQWVQQRLDSGLTLYTGRFNSRLLTAVWLDHNQQLDQLCVRPITRRRGVARQLLQLLCKRMDSQQQALSIAADKLPESLLPLCEELGFERQGEHWQRPPP